LLKDKEKAEELVQDLFCFILEKRKEIDVQSGFDVYLTRAVRNRSFNVIRHEKVVQNYIGQNQGLHSGVHIDNNHDFSLLKEKVDSCLAALPELSRTIFALSRDDGKSYQEIAAELGISIKTVEAHISKCLKLLREELKEFLVPLCLFLLEFYDSYRVLTDSGVIGM
jgi:RNA polymerase sigma-70 factor (ECF subfamily)